MKNKEIEEILNYMKQYVENKYEHDSEPMLNYKDLQIVLSYIEQLEKDKKELEERYNLVCKISEERKNKWLNLNEENDILFNTLKKYKLECESNEKIIHQLQKNRDKAIELIKNKLSFETHQHLKKLYDDIDSIEEIWEDYEFEDLLSILKGDSDENRNV